MSKLKGVDGGVSLPAAHADSGVFFVVGMVVVVLGFVLRRI